MRTCLIGLCLIAATGCGGDESNPVTSPSSSGAASSVAVDLQSVLLVGKNAMATATATLVNGQTRPVTTGWRSDTPAVATVTDSGSVTGVSNGLANIYVVFGGQQGASSLRVAPNYHGEWAGMQVYTACSATGEFAGLCNDEDLNALMGNSVPVALSARHPSDLTVSGEFVLEGERFPTFTSTIASNGSLGFAASSVIDDVTFVGRWQMNSTEDGRATGSIRVTLSLPGVATGDVTLDSTLSAFTRSVALASRPLQAGRGLHRSVVDGLRKLRRR